MVGGAFQGRLLEGEHIVWSGAPGQGVRLGGRDALLIPFSLLWCGFAIFWEIRVVSMNRAPLFMKLWGIPFVLVGLYVVFGRFLVDAYVRRRLHYAITGKRVLILREGLFASFTALSLDRLPEVRMTGGGEGKGTIYFGAAQAVLGRNGFAGLTPALDAAPKFIDIDNVQLVFDRIQRAVAVA